MGNQLFVNNYRVMFLEVQIGMGQVSSIHCSWLACSSRCLLAPEVASHRLCNSSPRKAFGAQPVLIFVLQSWEVAKWKKDEKGVHRVALDVAFICFCWSSRFETKKSRTRPSPHLRRSMSWSQTCLLLDELLKQNRVGDNRI